MGAEKTGLYAVLFPYQKEQIAAWCWGTCGAGIVGAVNLGPTMAVVCRRAPCPHIDKEMDESFGNVDGEPVRLRKLLPVTP